MSEIFTFIANHPALDFLNTETIRDGRRTDLLSDPQLLSDWFVAVGWQPVYSDEKLLTEAKHLREQLRLLAEARIAYEAAPADALAAWNNVLQSGCAYEQLESDFTARRIAQGNPLLPLGESVVDLLCRQDVERIRACGGKGCIRWFLDTSKNGKRRWCDMAGCGNREKAAAHYQRTHLPNEMPSTVA